MLRKINELRGQKGSMMVEAIAMLGLISMVTPVIYKKAAERTNEMQDINAAMKEMIGYDSSFGYPLCTKYVEDPDTNKKTCEQLVIRSREGTYQKGYDENEDSEVTDEFMFEIPYYIAKNGGFARTCNNDQSNALCLMYIYEYKARYYY